MIPGELYDTIYANTDATMIESEGSDVLRVDFGESSVWLYFTENPTAENFSKLRSKYRKQLMPILEEYNIPITERD